MDVLALTILISVFLAVIFIICFIAEIKKTNRRGLDHDALLPLADDDSMKESTHPDPSDSDPGHEAAHQISKPAPLNKN